MPRRLLSRPASKDAWAQAGPARLRDRDGRWRLAVYLVLIIGLVGASAGGWTWASFQANQTDRAFAATASSAGAAVDAGVRRDIDFARAFGQLVVTSPEPSNHRMGPWLTSLDPAENYPGTVGLSFVERIPLDRLSSYEAAVTADPIPGYGVGPYPIYPTGRRAVSCLSRFGLVVGSLGAPPGFDLCAPEVPGVGPSHMPQILDRATTSGQPQLVGLLGAFGFGRQVPTQLARTYGTFFMAIVPIYTRGTEPLTPAARSAALAGWVLDDFDGPALLTAALPSSRHVSVSLSSRGSMVAAIGSPRRGDRLVVTQPLSATPDLGMTMTTGRSQVPVVEGVLVGLLSGAIALMLFVFPFHLGRSREAALRLVDERTRELRRLALHDPLTGLANRSLLFDRAEALLVRAEREPRVIGALYVDLDNFKDVNDSFGHNVGDQLLKAVAERLQATVREADTVGRLGGDEFLVLTEDVANPAGPQLIAERILAVLAEPFHLDATSPMPIRVSASVGVAVATRSSAEELIRHADVALYQAKEAGKARSVNFQPDALMSAGPV